MIELRPGDCLEVLADMAPESVDACVTDPPYHLASIVKRFGADGAAPARGNDAYERASRGFMGKVWDGGDIAFRPETWAAVLRVLKPGAHLVAFGAPKNYHRLACAIEDAGFEIRDSLMWLFGSGFPKSHDVSKGIDKRKDWSALPRLQGAIGAARKALGVSQSEAARRMGLIEQGETLGGGGFMWFETGMRVPTREQWPRLKAALAIGDEFDQCFEEAEREVTGTHTEWSDRVNYAITSKDGLRRDKPASEAAREWQGWGTALKPAYEPIILARKPLIGTVAANVLAHGTGAINVDGCRVGTDGSRTNSSQPRAERTGFVKGFVTGTETVVRDQGRWPANIVHDGSDEVMAGFPVSKDGVAGKRTGTSKIAAAGLGGYDHEWGGYGGSGSAARFFYQAKASAKDRAGSKHPTVKPVALVRWLCRLVTPPGGLILDPFAGSGTTGQAAMEEGFRATLIEREAEYQADIRRRLNLPDIPTFEEMVA